jgi:hypothetical protein
MHLTTPLVNQTGKPARHITQNDQSIVDFLEAKLATVEQVAAFTGRPVKSIRRRLFELAEALVIERVKVGNTVYYASGFPMNRNQIIHDTIITWVYLGVWEKASLWVQDPSEFRDRRRKINGAFTLIPDAFFQLADGGNYFLEIERSKEARYDADGESNLIRKCKDYLKYHHSGEFTRAWFGGGEKEDFVVLLVVRSAKRAESLCRRFAQVPELNCKTFLFAVENEAVEQPLGAIWTTPRDYPAMHNLLD